MNNILFVCLLIGSLSCQESYEKKTFADKGKKEILLDNKVKIIIPLSQKFSDSLTYSNIEVFIDNVKVFADTTKTEYILNDRSYPRARKLRDNRQEILFKILGAPDLNNLIAYYFKNNKLIQSQILPVFGSKSEYIDGKNVYFGYLNITDKPCNDCDSCYYNPILYYQVTDNGIFLDSTITIMKNTNKWGGFYGFEISERVLPCK
jgi:uncharacterized protein YukJ